MYNFKNRINSNKVFQSVFMKQKSFSRKMIYIVLIASLMGIFVGFILSIFDSSDINDIVLLISCLLISAIVDKI